MSDELVVRPVITATLAQQKASSSCCGAKLDIGGEGDARYWLCRACRQPCERVLGDPVEVIARG